MRLAPRRAFRLAPLAGPLLAAAVIAVPLGAAFGEGDVTDAPAAAPAAAPAIGLAPAVASAPAAVPAEHRAAGSGHDEPRHDAASHDGAGHAFPTHAAAAHAGSEPPATTGGATPATERRATASLVTARPPAAGHAAPVVPGSGHVAPTAPVRRVSAAVLPGLLVPHVAEGMPQGQGSFLGTPALPAAPLPAGPTVVPPLAPAAVEAEVGRLRAAMAADVPGSLRHAPDSDRHWIALLRPMLAGDNAPTHPQLVVVVDRNIRVQQAALVMARPGGPWEVIGSTHVSTGQAGRWDHYITPVGVFPHTDLILDYRAEGTYNENHIRGLGVKGMRVWDFGWQWAHRGWGEDQSPIQIRMEMHATDPAVLAQRIGHTASQGCIRIPEALNRFFDHHGVLDADYERAAVDDIRYRALLPKDREPSSLAGDTLVVVDSSGAA